MIITKLSAIQISAALDSGEEVRVHGWVYGDNYEDMPVITKVSIGELFLLGVGAQCARIHFRTHPINPVISVRLDNEDRFTICQKGDDPKNDD